MRINELFESLSSTFAHTYAQNNFSKVLKIEKKIHINLKISLRGFQLHSGDGSKLCLTFR